ncbi:Phospholipase_D-nuclease N-terminal [Nonomuraea solani]|uniref:Phospholipase_D-nuclease N-terminal n=1 Tax=Nonomuraea solani TaxID=1144553 RepID=A0A1H6EZM1_9ACTN|nr:PLD nuclease N-terminal domain-containing protein [Nonomuraea solani]SEH02813.1 Phospholipase_D-nuclease N-terminal [Nonomuraea solani]
MLYLSQAAGLVTLVLWLYCLFDVITTPDTLCRNLPKLGWLIVVILVPLFGSLLWLIAGRPARAPQNATQPSAFPEYDRPGRFAAANPDDDEEFLRRCRERAEEQRRNAPKKPPEEEG